jgi:hypothetical protein
MAMKVSGQDGTHGGGSEDGTDAAAQWAVWVPSSFNVQWLAGTCMEPQHSRCSTPQFCCLLALQYTIM